ncbi:hypothetical protein WJX77_011386 [Trebouxia sp. C0004]
MHSRTLGSSKCCPYACTGKVISASRGGSGTVNLECTVLHISLAGSLALCSIVSISLQNLPDQRLPKKPGWEHDVDQAEEGAKEVET